MVAAQWTDKKQVNILSTETGVKMVTVERRPEAGVVQVQPLKPAAQFNSDMFGVDLNDQNGSVLSSWPPRHKVVAVSFQLSCPDINHQPLPDDSHTSAPQNSFFRLQLVKALVYSFTSSFSSPL